MRVMRKHLSRLTLFKNIQAHYWLEHLTLLNDQEHLCDEAITASRKKMIALLERQRSKNVKGTQLETRWLSLHSNRIKSTRNTRCNHLNSASLSLVGVEGTILALQCIDNQELFRTHIVITPGKIPRVFLVTYHQGTAWRTHLASQDESPAHSTLTFALILTTRNLKRPCLLTMKFCHRWTL